MLADYNWEVVSSIPSVGFNSGENGKKWLAQDNLKN